MLCVVSLAGRQTQEEEGPHSGLDRHRIRLRWRGFVHWQLWGCESVSSHKLEAIQTLHSRQSTKITMEISSFQYLGMRLHFLSCFPSDCPQMSHLEALQSVWNFSPTDQIRLLVSVVWRVRAGLHHHQVRWILHKLRRAAVPPGFWLGGPASGGNTRALKSKNASKKQHAERFNECLISLREHI